MFRKIVSALPYNPGLLHQLSFYAKRLHQEESVRRVGLIFTALALGVQTFAIFAPAETSLATSSNDIIYGATSKQQIVNALSSGRDNNGRADIRQIYDYYGITLNDIQAAESTHVKSRERQYVTTGRSDSPGVDTPVQVPGTGTTIYERSLNVWDIKNYENSYTAISGTASGNGLLKGRRFWILLKGCGNVTFEPTPRTPKLEMTKKLVGNGTYKAGEISSFRIDFRNSGNVAIDNATLTDTLAPQFELIEQTNPFAARFQAQGQNLSWEFGSIEPSQTWHSVVVKVKIKTIAEAKKDVCNASKFTTANAGIVTVSNPEKESCLTIDNSCPGTNLPAPDGDTSKCTYTCPDGSEVPYTEKDSCKSPVAVCEYLKIIDKPAWNKRTFEIKYAVSKGGILNKTLLLVNGKQVSDFGSTSETKTFTYTHTFETEGDFSAQANATAKSGTLFKSGGSCELTHTLVKPYTRISMSKKVKNITRNIADANNTTAKSGEELEYTLSISNSGNETATNYIIDSDVLSDVLAYADLVSYDGASFDRTHNRLTWPTVSIPPNQTITKTFRVNVKSPLPTTPESLSDPHLYDFAMINTFGNQITVKIDKPVANKTYEAVTSIPDTGAGSSIAVSLVAAMVIGYFYARSRLLAREVDLIKNEQVAGV